jgi:hypothetical protein
MKRIMFTAAAGATAIAGSIALAAPAMASNGPGTVTAVTHSANHPDTTNVAGPATLSSGNGPVWAWDNTATKITVTPYATTQTDGANYSVAITETGQFQGFADPTNGSALTSTGSLKGTIQYDVYSANQPSAANLPAQEPGAATQDQAGIDGGYTHLGGMINQLFGGSPVYGAPQVVGYKGGGDYHFAYQDSPGNPGYVQNQVGPNLTITGDVTGH